MSPLDAMVRAHWESGRTAGWPMLEELTDAQRYDMKEQMRAALIALRDCEVTEGMLKTTALCPDTARYTFIAILDAALEL